MCPRGCGGRGGSSVKRISTSPREDLRQTLEQNTREFSSCFLLIHLRCWDRSLLARQKNNLTGPAPARSIRMVSGKCWNSPGPRADSKLGPKAWFLRLPLFQAFLAHSIKVKSVDSKAKQTKFYFCLHHLLLCDFGKFTLLSLFVFSSLKWT